LAGKKNGGQILSLQFGGPEKKNQNGKWRSVRKNRTDTPSSRGGTVQGLPREREGETGFSRGKGKKLSPTPGKPGVAPKVIGGRSPRKNNTQGEKNQQGGRGNNHTRLARCQYTNPARATAIGGESSKNKQSCLHTETESKIGEQGRIQDGN